MALHNSSAINTMVYNGINNITCRERKPVPNAPAVIQNDTSGDKTIIGEISKDILEKPKKTFPKVNVVSNVDIGDAQNPNLVPDYVVDIYNHLTDLESHSIIKPGFLQDHPVTPLMRAVLVDWLVQVHIRFSLLQDTLQLTTGILDRVLQATDNVVTRDDLQLLGITAAFIASKFEEVCPPDLDDLVYLAAGCYNIADVLQMERQVLATLRWNVSFPLPIQFLRRYSKVGHATAQQHTLAKFLEDLSLQEYSLCHQRPSMLAAAALHLSQKMLPGDTTLCTDLTQYSDYTEDELRHLVDQLASVLEACPSSKLMAVREKYRCNSILTYLQIKKILYSKEYTYNGR